MSRLNRHTRRAIRAGSSGHRLPFAIEFSLNQPLAIEIPTLLDLSRLGERQELQLRGRVLAPAGIDEIAVMQEGTVAFRLRHRGARAPDQDRYGFSCDLTRPASHAGDAWNVDIVASRHGIHRRASGIQDRRSGRRHGAGARWPERRRHCRRRSATADDPPRRARNAHTGHAASDRRLGSRPRHAPRHPGVRRSPRSRQRNTRSDASGRCRMATRISQRSGVGFLFSLHLPMGEPPSILRIEAETEGAHQLELTVPVERIGDWSAPKPIGRREIPFSVTRPSLPLTAGCP